jgi:hypothetical protein
MYPLVACRPGNCNSLHFMGNGVLLLEFEQRGQPAGDQSGRQIELTGNGKAYFPPSTSFAMVASCILDVPS